VAGIVYNELQKLCDDLTHMQDMHCDLEVWEFQKHWSIGLNTHKNQYFSWFEETPQSVVTHTSRRQIYQNHLLRSVLSPHVNDSGPESPPGGEPCNDHVTSKHSLVTFQSPEQPQA
jgi:hypothetical protein